MQKYLASHLPMALIYGLLVFAIKGLLPFVSLANYINWLGWILGVIVGVIILFADRIAYTYSYPGTQIAQQFNWYWQQKKYGSAITLLYDRRLEAERLTFRSSLFIIIWIPLAFFALTSTSGLFGKGVVMGIMLHVLLDSWRLQKADPRRLHLRLFWLIKRVITDQERLIFLYFVSSIFVIFSFWVS